MSMTLRTWTVKNFVSTRLPLSEVQYEILYGLKTDKYTAWREYVVDLRINHDKDKGYILCRTRR